MRKTINSNNSPLSDTPLLRYCCFLLLFGWSLPVLNGRTIPELIRSTETLSDTYSYADVLINEPPVAVCQNITVSADADCHGIALASAFDGGSSDPDGDPLTFSVNPAGPYDLGATNVILTVSDGNSNTSTCTATITVEDTTPPTLICKDATIFIDGNSQTGFLRISDIDNGSFDNCSGLNPSSYPYLGKYHCYNIGPKVLTLTIWDNTGNASTCTVNVLVTLPQPDARCKNATVYLSSPSITAADLNDNSSQICGFGVSLSASHTTFSCSDIGPNNVTLTVTGKNPTPSTCTSIVTVIDDTSPVAVCKTTTTIVQLNSAGIGNLSAVAVDGGSTDDCSLAGLSVAPNSFNCGDMGSNTVTLTATDVQGNTSSCTATVLVQDHAAPTAVCQNATIQLNAQGNAFIIPTTINNGSSDACGLQNLSVAPNSFNCGDVGSNTVTLTATDVQGNTSSCTATVLVQDHAAPTVRCQNTTIQLDAQGNASITAANINGGSGDACGIASLSVAPNSFGCENVGSNTVTLTATDVNGNTSTCTATVSVQDNVAPTALCQDATVQLNAQGNGSISTTAINKGSSDACGIASLSVAPNSFNCGDVGLNTVTLTITDPHGNPSTCEATVSVQDIGLIAFCQNATVQLNAQGNGSISTTDINNGSSDACGGTVSLSVSPSSFDCADVGPKTVTLTATDENSNTSTCTSTVTIEDTQLPVPDANNLSIITGECSATVSSIPTATDNCAGTVTGTTDDPLSYSEQGTYSITWTYDDGNGNIETQMQSVIVDDISKPIPDVETLPTVSGECSATVVTVPTATDACEGSITGTTDDPVSYSEQGTYSITWTYNDGNGNIETQMQSVIVDDISKPIPDVETLPTVSGECSATVVTVPTATDACEGSITGTTDDPVSYSEQGTYSITWTYNDGNGNIETQMQSVIVDDISKPIPDVETLPTVSGECSATVVTVPTATDACEGSITGTTDDPVSYSEQGTYSITWTYNDGNGNIETQMQSVIVDDISKPIPDVETLPTVSGECSATVVTVPTATDACKGSITGTTDDPVSYSEQGTYSITWTYNDGNGNIETQMQSVIVDDISKPIPDVETLPTVSGECSATVVTVPTATDACEGSITGTTDDPVSYSEQGTYSITWTYNDGNGNSKAQSQTVIIDDNSKPEVLTKNITVQLDVSGKTSIIAADIDNGTNDPCGIATLEVIPRSFDCTKVGENTVTLTASDNNGNINTKTAIIKVEDNINPNAICKNTTIQLDKNGSATTSSAAINNGSNDACGIASISLDKTSFSCSDVGNNTVVLTVKDQNNNTSTCNAVVKVEDNIKPTIILKEEISIWPPNHKYKNIQVTDMVDFVTDNCASVDVPDVYILSVSSDEPENETGGADGNTYNDIIIHSNCQSVKLRKERNELGNGRVYTILLGLTDVNSNTSTVSYIIGVRISPDLNGPAIDDGSAYSVDCGSSSLADNNDNQVKEEESSQPLVVVEQHSNSLNQNTFENTPIMPQLKAYPNPFRDKIILEFSLSQKENTVIEVFNIQGQMVKVLLPEFEAAGQHRILWDGTDQSGQQMPSGIYLIRMRAGEVMKIQKVLLQR